MGHSQVYPSLAVNLFVLHDSWSISSQSSSRLLHTLRNQVDPECQTECLLFSGVTRFRPVACRPSGNFRVGFDIFAENDGEVPVVRRVFASVRLRTLAESRAEHRHCQFGVGLNADKSRAEHRHSQFGVGLNTDRGSC